MALQFKGEFDGEDINAALDVIRGNANALVSNKKLIDRIADVYDSLKIKGIICEIITEN